MLNTRSNPVTETLCCINDINLFMLDYGKLTQR